jgi:protein arginine kinase
LSIGRTEEEMITVITRVIENLAERETQERGRLWSVETADRVYRAYGLLSHARRINGAEYLQALSDVRWGILEDRFGTRADLAKLDDALDFLKKGALNYLAGRVLPATEQAVLRATYARELMTGIEVRT